MKHLKYIFMAFAVALFATSCSQDELPEDGGDTPVTGQTKTYTFTVSPDIVMEGDAKTRSEGTDAEKPTRCFMQVFDNDVPVNTSVIKGEENNGSYTFTVTLASDKSYDYCFYADNGDANISDLRSIEWPTTGDVVAYAHKLSGKPEEVTASVTLKHIVTKITLQHKGEAFTATANNGFTVTYPCVTSYNVLNPEKSPTTNISFVNNFTVDTAIEDSKEICTYYIAVPTDYTGTDITLTYRWRYLTIADVTLKQDAHVVLQGDLSPDNIKWQMSNSDVERVKYYFFDSENDCKGSEIGGGMYCQATKEQIGNICKDITGQDFNTTVVSYQCEDNNSTVQFLDMSSYCIVNIKINGVYYSFSCYYDTSYGYPSLLP